MQRHAKKTTCRAGVVKKMSHRITISDEAFKIISSHSSEFRETHAEAVDELLFARDAVWSPTKLNPGAGRVWKQVP